MNEIIQTATVDETQGFVQGVDQAAIEAALASYQQQIEEYINHQDPDATVGEVLGIQQIAVGAADVIDDEHPGLGGVIER